MRAPLGDHAARKRMEAAVIDAVSSGAYREVVVPLAGEIDVAGCAATKERLHAMVDDGARHLVLDLHGLTFMDSTALGMLVGLQRRLQSLDGLLELRAPTSPIRRALAITGLDQVLHIVD
jgi:anti-sigma B factor antagonist